MRDCTALHVAKSTSMDGLSTCRVEVTNEHPTDCAIHKGLRETIKLKLTSIVITLDGRAN